MNWIIIAGALAFVAVWIFLLVKGKWFMNWPQWARLVSMITVAAGMFALVWYMQSEETKREGTMMGLCWDSQGKAHYPEKWDVNAYCDDPQPLDWKKSPKLVYWDLPKDFDSYSESHKLAMKFWNKELDQEHLVQTIDRELADITIVWGSANEGTGSMSTSHTKVGDRITATITVKTPGDVRRWLLEEQHEYGHVLGLCHDRSGLMNPGLDEGEEMRVWLLHQIDLDAVLDSLRPKEKASSLVPAVSE
jgi:hypothetical protein